MATIEIDFEVFKALTALRASEQVTFNDVIRTLLKLKPQLASAPTARNGWHYKGVFFPEGTQFKAAHKGLAHYARVENGAFTLLDGRKMKSPSEAANTITGTSVNGWTFWECQFPGEIKWRLLSAVR